VLSNIEPYGSVSHGLAACKGARPSARFRVAASARAWTVTRRVLNVPEDQWIVCGVSLGWADESASVNALVADREPIDAFATFHGFEEDAA
jgi:hypothetical protein